MESKIKTTSVIIGVDFSINKPAITIYHNGKYKFICLPYTISDKNKNIFLNYDVEIINRSDDKDKGENISSKMRYEIINANYLADIIFKLLEPYLIKNSCIAFEGLSYGSSGDVALQLGGYKYILMNKLGIIIPFENMYTYSPLTVKATAGCSERGKKKEDMINAFIEKGPDCKLIKILKDNPNIFKKKGKGKKPGKWIDNLDDIVDSYWTLQTLVKKENIILSS
jgi:hypothetical protein